ncbi:5-oxoprolinase subunit PxpB [Winogradskyella ursingii]|uniref:5-oxoprolinase subunit PxpB n=1 Tax=Winogradskyella ursingii TaxID=2686079 RepID=UPI0015C775CC|nr:5-oxoprolinase subunit PxpB [Winogradskyella ursingii]
MVFELRYSQYNSHSILIEWPAIIDDIILENILNFKFDIEKHFLKQKIEVVNAYNSLLVIYSLTIDNINDEIFILKSLYKAQNNQKKLKFNTWEIPVCYHDEFAQDLDDFSKIKKLSKSQIIHLHSQPIYTVYFIGFLPGFLYLGGLNSQLHLDRKISPDLNIKKGSVAIGGEQTGIYPQNSPGGWHVIGNSPISIFDVNLNPPCQIKSGDCIKFSAIDNKEHNEILNMVENSSYQLKTL